MNFSRPREKFISPPLRLVILIVICFLTTRCATRAVQTEALRTARATAAKPIPEKFEIPGVPFVEQAEGYCGPATLAMAMRYRGQNVDVGELAGQVYSPAKKGAMPADLVGATRRHGLLGVQVFGLEALLQEIANGNPVIIFENLAFDWFPRWHYAVAYGYDLNDETITLHSGPTEAKRWSMYKFERSWMRGDYWGLVVLPPGKLSASGGELAHVTAASGLEQSDRSREAEASYRVILEKWPTSLGSLIGLGNLAYARKNFARSVEVLKRASEVHPNLAVVWHNLAVAEGAMNQKAAARRSAARAMELASQDEIAAYRESLKNWLTTRR